MGHPHDGIDPAIVSCLEHLDADVSDVMLDVRELQARLSSSPEHDFLRDRFAMAALTGIAISDVRAERPNKKTAKWCYAMADAMIEEREVRDGSTTD
jgi:hypothetical protein